ncbi:hypothetical protein [Desertibaculum subflavum]|uniref:hypothetical protein n=1 Tax=Desertibaculum subflavum TaxID=2268458 RepID=UPI000E665EB6
MWDGISYVEPSRRPVIHEGFGAAQVIVSNAGPGVVDLLVWSEPMRKPDEPPAFRMRMIPGNTRSASGPMIAVGLSEDQRGSLPAGAPFAAIGWRMVR